MKRGGGVMLLGSAGSVFETAYYLLIYDTMTYDVLQHILGSKGNSPAIPIATLFGSALRVCRLQFVGRFNDELQLYFTPQVQVF
mmetsp:Transcript_13256/g.20467  ORF Transcript_13256/g.20467 Transcript_13256/m.20467 type:complete len:84 (+) Transcript_13256:621-872(+)